jgi:hypothetical protein
VTESFPSMTDAHRPRRSIILRLTAALANAYLIAFALDAVLSISDIVAGDPELHGMASAHPAMYAARVALALAIVVVSMLMPFLLLFVPQLPKLPFPAPIVFTLVASFGRFLTGLSVEWFAVAQPLVAASSFVLVKLTTGAWLLSSARLPRKRHLVVRTVFATLVTIVALPLTVTALVVLILLGTLERQSGGYLDVTVSGIDLHETVLTKDGRTVVLKAMLHFGEGDFYRTLFDGIPAGSLVLAEGITDRQKRLLAFPSASKIANVLGLAPQPDPKAMLPPPDDAARGNPDESPRPATSGDPPDVVNADVDAAEFSNATLAVLRDVAGIYDSDSIADAVRRVVSRDHAREEFAVMKRELVDMRNAKLLATFDAKAAQHTTIVIPWGAMHMPGLEAGLAERGYHVDVRRTRPVVRFARLVGWLAGLRSA